MSIFSGLVKSSTKFIKSFKHKNNKQLVELQRLEKEIEDLTKKKEKSSQNIILTNRTFLKFWLIGMFVVFLAYVIFQTLDIIYLIITAFIVSIAMEAVIDFIQNKKISR